MKIFRSVLLIFLLTLASFSAALSGNYAADRLDKEVVIEQRMKKDEDEDEHDSTNDETLEKK